MDCQDHEEVRRSREIDPSSSDDDDFGLDEPHPDDLDPDQERTWRELQAFRQRLDDGTECRCNDFVVQILGGAWTASHRGSRPMLCKVGPRATKPRLGARCRGVPFSARFEIAAYSEAPAAIMARAWCSKMQHAYEIALREALGEAVAPEQRRDWKEP